MVVKIYVSGISGNKEVKKKQQRVQMILDSKSVVYEAIDITEPGREKDKETMQSKSKVREVLGKHPLPPQLFNDEEYCGDYEDFDLANEVDELEAFLHLPIPSKLISCDNDTLTAKVNGSREGDDGNVTNGEPAEKDEETADNDATPEENIVNSAPDEIQQTPQTSQNEIEEEEVKENEIDSEVTEKETEDDRLNIDEKVEDEINDDEQIAQQENDVPNTEIKIDEVVSENKKVDEAEEIGVDKKELMPASDILVSEITKNDNNNVILGLDDDNVSLSRKESESKTAVLASKNIAEVAQEINNNVTAASDKSILKIIDNKTENQTESSDLELTKSQKSVGPVATNLDIPSDYSKARQISVLEKTEPLEWVDNIDIATENKQMTKLNKKLGLEKNSSVPCVTEQIKEAEAITQTTIQEHKQVNRGKSQAVNKNDTSEEESKNKTILKENSEEHAIVKHEPVEKQLNSEQNIIQSASFIVTSEENETMAVSETVTAISEECSIAEISKKSETKDEPKIICDMPATVINNPKEMNRENEEKEKSKSDELVILPSQEEKSPELIQVLNATTTKLENVSDLAPMSFKTPQEINVDRKIETEINTKGVITSSEPADASLSIIPSPKENKSDLTSYFEDKQMSEVVMNKKEDDEDDLKWEGKPLCRRDTLKKIKRPSIPLIRPSSIKEESTEDNDIKKQTGVTTSVISSTDQNIIMDFNSNECTVELTSAGNEIGPNLTSPCVDSEKEIRKTTSGSNTPSDLSTSNVRGNNQITLQSSSTNTANVNKPSDLSTSNVRGNNQITLQSSSTNTANSNQEQNTGRTAASTSSSPQSSASDSQNNNLSNSSAQNSININSASNTNNVRQSTGFSGSVNIQLEDASGQISNLEEIQLPGNTTDGVSPIHSGLPMKELLKEKYASPFSVDKIAFSPQLVSKIKSDSLKRDEKGVVLPNWDRRPSEVDLVRQVRYLLDERDTEIAISRARMRAGRSPLRDPHQHFVVEMKKMINKYKDEEDEVEWPVVPPPREPTPPPPEPPVNEFLEEVLKALNAPYIPKPKPPPEESKENIFLNQVKVLLDSEHLTGDTQATFFQKERGPVDDPEFVHKVRVILNERESTLGLKPMENPEKRDHTEFLSDVLVLLEEEPHEVPEIKAVEPPVINVEHEAVKEESIVEEVKPIPSPPIVEEKIKTPQKQVKEKSVKKPEDDVPKKKEIEIAQIFIRDNIFPVTAQVSTDNFRIFVSALGSQKIELQKEDLDALTITVIEDNGYKSDVAKIVVSPTL